MKRWLLLLLLPLSCFGQAFSFSDLAFMDSGVTISVGTNGVLWWTNSDTSAHYLIDPIDADLGADDAKSIAARACTNLESLISAGAVTNLIFNNLPALTNLELASAGLNLTQAKPLWQLLVDNGGSNASAFILSAVPDAETITNVVILSDRGYTVAFGTPANVYFFPINTTYVLNGVTKFVGDAWGDIPDSIYSIARGSDIHYGLNPIADMIILTNADFNGDGFDQGRIDNLLSDMANNAPPNGTLDLRNMVAPTDGGLNADYQTLTNNGWTVLLTP